MKSKFVAVPFLVDLASQQLQYVDILTYLTIRSRQEQYSTVFPSRRRIALAMGASEYFVGKSIKRLIRNKFLSINKSGDERSYEFCQLPTFMMLPKKILKANLSLNEKAILLMLKMFCLDDHYDIGPGIKLISDVSGIDIKELAKNIKQLYKKKFLRQVKSKDLDHPYYFKLSNAINWVDDGGHNAKMIEIFKQEIKGTHLVFA